MIHVTWTKKRYRLTLRQSGTAVAEMDVEATSALELRHKVALFFNTIGTFAPGDSLHIDEVEGNTP